MQLLPPKTGHPVSQSATLGWNPPALARLQRAAYTYPANKASSSETAPCQCRWAPQSCLPQPGPHHPRGINRGKDCNTICCPGSLHYFWLALNLCMEGKMLPPPFRAPLVLSWAVLGCGQMQHQAGSVLPSRCTAQPHPAWRLRGAWCCGGSTLRITRPGGREETPRQGSARASEPPDKVCSCLSLLYYPSSAEVVGVTPLNKPCPHGSNFPPWVRAFCSLSVLPSPFISLTSPGPSCGSARPPSPSPRLVRSWGSPAALRAVPAQPVPPEGVAYTTSTATPPPIPPTRTSTVTKGYY